MDILIFKANNILKKFDILGPRIEFKFQNEVKFKSFYGFLLTVLLFVLCIVTTVPTLRDYIYKTNPKIFYEESVTYDKTLIDNTSFDFFIQISYYDIVKNNIAMLEENEIEENPTLMPVQRKSDEYIYYNQNMTSMIRCKNLDNFSDIINKDITSNNSSQNNQISPNLLINTFCIPNKFVSFIETKTLKM